MESITGVITIDCDKDDVINFNRVFKPFSFQNFNFKLKKNNNNYKLIYKKNNINIDINQHAFSKYTTTYKCSISGNILDEVLKEIIINWFINVVNELELIQSASLMITNDKSIIIINIGYSLGGVSLTFVNEPFLAAKYTLLNKYHIHTI